MKTKTTFLSLFFMLASMGLWAQSTERVYIRTVTNNPTTASTEVVIYESGEIKTKTLSNALSSRETSLESFAKILEKYFNKGFKLVGTSSAIGGTNMFYSEYILEKTITP